MSRKTKMTIILAIDSMIIVFASLLSNIYLASIMPVSRRYMVYALVLQWALYILFGFLFNVFNRINRYTSINSLIAIFGAVTVYPLLAHKIVADRLGHDKRYAIDPTKLETELGWKPKYTFETGIVETIDWYVENEKWWRPLQKRAELN